jgi:PKD repeat protein
VPSSPVVFTNASTGFPVWYHWDFGDGVNSERRNPTHRYARTGVYTVTLTAGNAVGATTVSEHVHVEKAAPRRPSGRVDGP